MTDASVNDQFLEDINAIIDLVRARDTDNALGMIQSSLPKYPDAPELLLLASVCSYQQDDIGRAIELCEAAHKLAPDGQEIVDSLAVLHVLVGNHNDGLYYAKLATTMSPHPDIPDLLPLEFSNFFAALNASKPSRHYLDGLFSFNARAYDDAIGDFQRELRINPDNNAALKKLGHSFVRNYCPTDALEVLKSFDERVPGDGEVSALRAIAYCQLAEFNEAAPLCRQALQEAPDDLNVAMLALEASMFFDESLDAVYQECIAALNARVDAALDKEDAPAIPAKKGEHETINIALVSNSLYASDAASFIFPLIENIDTTRFTLTIYQQSPTGGAVFGEMKGKAKHWRRIVDMDDDVLDLIFDRAHTDIVIDMCGFSENGRPTLFALSKNRLVANLMCPPYGDDIASTNLVISDAVTAENDKAALRPDQINVSIESGLFGFNEPRLMGEVAALPAIDNKHITFGGTASLRYVSSETVTMWSAILNAVPGSKLHLGYVENATVDVKERARALFAEAGIDGRVSVWNTDYDQRANPTYFNQIDVFLDTYPFSNPLTVSHALWMGVPVISRKGKTRRAMMGASALNAAGKPQWIAGSTEDAVAIAKELCSDLDSLSGIRKVMRDDVKASKLFDAKGYVNAFQDTLEKAVQEHAAKA